MSLTLSIKMNIITAATALTALLDIIDAMGTIYTHLREFNSIPCRLFYKYQ